MHYSTSKYNKFTPAEKAKLWQLKNPGKTPGTGPYGRKTNKSSATVAELTTAMSAVSAAALAISELTAATTKQTAAEEGETNDDDRIAATNPVWGQNHDNPAVAGRQRSVPKKEKNRPTGRGALSAFHTAQLAIDPRRYITDLSTKINSISETTLELDSHTDTLF
jgi:hypothetical protein